MTSKESPAADLSKKQKKTLLFWIFFICLLALYAILLTSNKNSFIGWIVVLAVFGAMYALKRFITNLRPWVMVVCWVVIGVFLVIPFNQTISPSLPSLQARAFKALMLYDKTHQAPWPQDEALFIKLTREFIEKTVKNWSPRKDVVFEAVDVGGLPGEWVYKKGTLKDKVVLYIHGGGFVAGSPKISRPMSEGLAYYSGVKVLAIDYRLAPENPFPAGLEDCIKAYRWLISQGIQSKKIIIAGDSAGGDLALATGLALKEKQIELPAGFIAISPCTDLAITGESARTRAKDDPMLDPSMHNKIITSYLPKGANRKEFVKNPLVSPLYGSFKTFPPVLIEVGSEEILYDDSRRMVEKLKADGVNATLREWKGLWHVFQYFTILPESARSFEEMGHFIRLNLGMENVDR